MKKHGRMRVVADNVKKYRMKNGWTQEELAEQAEVSHAFVNQIENCKRDMTLGYCNQICNALDITPNDLLKIEKQHGYGATHHIQRFVHLTREMEDHDIHFILDLLESMKKPIDKWKRF